MDLFSAIILSAGDSKRMGKTKALLKTNNNVTFIEQITDLYEKFGCQKIICIANKELFKQLIKIDVLCKRQFEIVENTHTHKGRFYSLQLGTMHINSPSHCFIHNIDNPAITDSVLLKLAKEINDINYCVPIHNNKGGHPILLNKKIVEDIKNLQNIESDLPLNRFLRNYDRTNIEIDNASIHLNINTIADYNKFLKCY